MMKLLKEKHLQVVVVCLAVEVVCLSAVVVVLCLA
jgi:hypothetical protein